MAGMRFFKGWLGPFKLHRRYNSQQQGPGRDDLGHLYEASLLLTDKPALVLIPSQTASMEPQEEWRVRLRSQANPPLLSLEVEQAPTSGRLSQLRGMLALLGTCVERLDSSEAARAHLTQLPPPFVKALWDESKDIYHWVRVSPWRILAACVVALLVILMGAFEVAFRAHRDMEAQRQAAREAAVPSVTGSRAPTLVDLAGESAAPIAYPLPPKPFLDQAKAPCNPKKGQVEINGGCWVELAKTPPCYDDQAEYQGKCYLPVSARSQKPREPHSIQP